MEHEKDILKISALALFACYIKNHLKALLLFCLFICIFTATMLLYGYPPDGVFYAVVLCFFITAIFLVLGFLSFVKKHRQLAHILTLKNIDDSVLPRSEQLIEQDYLLLCKKLLRQNASLVSEYETDKADTTDYFTLWVHQVKTPIFAMQLLLSDSISEKDRELSHELFKIEQYVGMVLSYLRLGSGTNDFVIKPYSLNEIVRQAIRKFAPLFIRKKLSIDYTPVTAEILTDEKWFLFMIEQLLSNAVKYTKAGKVSIYMDGPSTLVIEDTGIGIAPEDLPRIFEKGYTGYNGRTDKKASGLGLYLCRRIAASLSHTLRIESEPDKGTRVYIGFYSKKILFD